MKRKIFAFVFSVLSTVILPLSFSYAGDQEQSQTHGVNTNWEDFKRRCANPAQFGNQVPPSNIAIRCKIEKFSWKQMMTETATRLPSYQKMTTSLKSSKADIPETMTSVEANVQEFGLACPRFKEIVYSYEISKAVSCDEVKGATTIQALCAKIIDTDDQGGGMGVTRETGRIATTECKVQEARYEREQTQVKNDEDVSQK